MNLRNQEHVRSIIVEKLFSLILGKTWIISPKLGPSFTALFTASSASIGVVGTRTALRVSGSNNICDHSTGREIVSLEITFTLHYLIAHNANAIPAANKNNNCILVYIINTSNNNNNNIYIYISFEEEKSTYNVLSYLSSSIRANCLGVSSVDGLVVETTLTARFHPLNSLPLSCNALSSPPSPTIQIKTRLEVFWIARDEITPHDLKWRSYWCI